MFVYRVSESLIGSC